VFDRALIPADYVRNTKNQDRGYVFANYVGKEIHAGRATAILFGGDPETGSGHGGAFYVHPDHMQRLQREWDSRGSNERQEGNCESHSIVGSKPVFSGVIDARHAERVCESLASIDTTLDEIYRVLERLTTAVESVATQPRAEEHLRREIHAACDSANGFHN
jgi:hypothetical protein